MSFQHRRKLLNVVRTLACHIIVPGTLPSARPELSLCNTDVAVNRPLGTRSEMRDSWCVAGQFGSYPRGHLGCNRIRSAALP